MGNSQGTFFVFENIADDAVLTTTNDVVEELGIDNMLLSRGDEVWRVFGDGGNPPISNFTITFPEDRDYDTIALHWPRPPYPGVTQKSPAIATGDTISVTPRTLAGDPVAEGVVVSASMDIDPSHPVWWHRVDAEINVRSIDVSITATSRLGTFADNGGVFVGSSMEPEGGIIYPAPRGRQFNRNIRKTPAGRVYATGYASDRRWRMSFDALSPSEEAVLEAAIAVNQGVNQIFLVRGERATGPQGMFGLIDSVDDFRLRDPELSSADLTIMDFV